LRFRLRTLFLVGILISVFLAFKFPFIAIFRSIPPFFLPLIPCLFLLLRHSSSSASKRDDAPSSSKTPQKFPLEFFLGFPLLCLTFSFILASENAEDRALKTTYSRLEEPSTQARDGWGNLLQNQGDFWYSYGPDQQDNQGYYDDIAPALSVRDSWQKRIRWFWVFQKQFFFFFLFGIIYLLILFLYRFFQNTQKTLFPWLSAPSPLESFTPKEQEKEIISPKENFSSDF
jgi:hypothetical protein